MSDLQSAADLKAAAMNLLDDSSTSTPTGEATVPPTEPQAPVAPVAAAADPSAAPTPPAPAAADEPKEGDKDWKVPGERLQEEVKKRKELEAELETERKKREELEAAKAPSEPEDDPADEDDDIELKPEVLKAMKKQGFLTRAEAEKLAEEKTNGILAADKVATARAQQGAQDRVDLTKEMADKGYPEFKVDEVLPKAIELVGEANLSKQALRAAYIELHSSDIENTLIKQANASKSAPTATAERPGGSPAVNAAEVPATGPEATKAKIAAAIVD